MYVNIDRCHEQLDLAVWARDRAFPAAPARFGWTDKKGKQHPCSSLDELRNVILADEKGAVTLVWTPDFPYCRVPEELKELKDAIQRVRSNWARDDLDDANYRLRNVGIGFGVFMAYMIYQSIQVLKSRAAYSGLDLGWMENVIFVMKTLAASPSVGLVTLGFLIFAFIPWYQARKKQKEMMVMGVKIEDLVPALRFETWLGMQRAPITHFLMAILSVLFMTQVFRDGSLFVFRDTVVQAGLQKTAYQTGDWWRLFTAPLLHGGLIHFAMNASAVMYLGKRVEVFARWPHVAFVFLFAALVGGEASTRFLAAPSVGASGGLMGWLGFLLVFETLHARLVPKSAKRRLLAGVFLTALIGFIGYRFIDNAAHLGGLISGMVYAGIVFPKTSSVLRPKIMLGDQIAGTLALGIIILSACKAWIEMSA